MIHNAPWMFMRGGIYAKPNVAIFNIDKCIQFNTFFLLFAYFYSI